MCIRDTTTRSSATNKLSDYNLKLKKKKAKNSSIISYKPFIGSLSPKLRLLTVPTRFSSLGNSQFVGAKLLKSASTSVQLWEPPCCHNWTTQRTSEEKLRTIFFFSSRNDSSKNESKQTGVEKDTIFQPFAVNLCKVLTELLKLCLRMSAGIRKAD